MKTRRIVLAFGVGAYLVSFGMLTGMVVGRLRFDRQRSEVLARYERAVTDLNAHRIALEKLAGGHR
jgi:hypothetical protein